MNIRNLFSVICFLTGGHPCVSDEKDKEKSEIHCRRCGKFFPVIYIDCSKIREADTITFKVVNKKENSIGVLI